MILQDKILVIRYGVIAPLLLVMWPSTFFGGDIGKQVSAVTLIGSVFLILLTSRSVVKADKLFVFLLFYFSYLILNILINPLFHDAGSFRDFAELFRVIGCLGALILGFNFGFKGVKNKHIYALLIFLLFMEVVFILDLKLPLFNMYITKFQRFSGYAVAVNYVFSIFLFCLLMLHLRRTPSSPNLELFFYIIMISAILLSGSRTSVAILLFSAVVMYANHFYKIIRLRSIIFIGLFCYLFSVSGYLDPLLRILSILEPLLALSIDLEDYPTLLKRFLMWEKYFPLIQERIFIGYGGAKDTLRIIDNSFLMTLLRYGLVGLVLETILYVTMLFLSFRTPHSKLFSVFILGHLISGITTSFMYELRTPYLVFYIFGIIWSKSNYKDN